LPYRAPEFLSLCVEENESGRVLETVKRCQHAPCFALDIQPDDDQAALVLFFDPIHDGLHRCAGNSVRGLEFEQDRRARSDARLDLGSVEHMDGLARVQEGPRHNRSEHQHAKGQNLEPFWVLAQQDEPGDTHQESGDPNRGILIEDFHF